MKKYSLITFSLLAMCHPVNAEVPQTALPCPGCLIQLPAIEVSDTANPTQVAYQNLLKGMDAFKAQHAHAPRAELRFVVQSLTYGEILSGLTASLAVTGLNLPLQLDKDGIFELPRLELAVAKDSAVVVNRREGSVRIWPHVRSPNTAPEEQRMGDLRLECEIYWAMEKDELSFVARSAFRLIGGPCNSSQSKATFRVVKKLLAANLLLGNRKLAVPIDKTGYAFSPPLHDQSWPDDAIIALEFEKR